MNQSNTQPGQPIEKMLTTKQAAELTGTSASTLQYYRFMKQPPAYVKLGRRIFYRPDDLRAWIEQGVIEPEVVE